MRFLNVSLVFLSAGLLPTLSIHAQDPGMQALQAAQMATQAAQDANQQAMQAAQFTSRQYKMRKRCRDMG